MSTQESGQEVQSNPTQNTQSGTGSAQAPDKAGQSLKLRLENESTVHNFTGSAHEVWKALAKCSGSGVKGQDDQPKDGIAVRNFMAHTVEMVNRKTGEITNPARIVLVTPEGDCYAFVSDFLGDSIDLIIASFGIGPWEPPIKLRVNESPTRSGFKVLTIDPA